MSEENKENILKSEFDILDSKMSLVLSGLSTLIRQQKELTQTVVSNKTKVDDIASLLINKKLQINNCVRDMKEVKSTCTSLKHDMSEAKENLFDCMQFIKLSSAKFNKHYNHTTKSNRNAVIIHCQYYNSFMCDIMHVSLLGLPYL